MFHHKSYNHATTPTYYYSARKIVRINVHFLAILDIEKAYDRLPH